MAKMATKEETVEAPSMDAKEMLKTNGEAKRVIRYGDRKTVEIIVDTKHYRKGQVINPHVVMAEQLIKDKIAKAV